MATIVRSKSLGFTYVLVGTGYGAHLSEMKDTLLNTTLHKNAGTHPMVCVCNSKGETGWLYASDCLVISVDGLSPETLLEPFKYKSSPKEPSLAQPINTEPQYGHEDEESLPTAHLLPD